MVLALARQCTWRVNGQTAGYDSADVFHLEMHLTESSVFVVHQWACTCGHCTYLLVRISAMISIIEYCKRTLCTRVFPSITAMRTYPRGPMQAAPVQEACRASQMEAAPRSPQLEYSGNVQCCVSELLVCDSYSVELTTSVASSSAIKKPVSSSIAPSATKSTR